MLKMFKESGIRKVLDGAFHGSTHLQLSTWEVEIRRSKVKNYPSLHSTFQAILGYKRYCFKKQIDKQTTKPHRKQQKF